LYFSISAHHFFIFSTYWSRNSKIQRNSGPFIIFPNFHNSSSTSSPETAERYNPETGKWEFIYFPEDSNFPINYRRFSTADGPENSGTYFFSGFGVGNSSTYFPETPFLYNSDLETVVKIEAENEIFPISEIGLKQIFEPKRFDSIGGYNYIVHHRTQECTNGTMR